MLQALEAMPPTESLDAVAADTYMVDGVEICEVEREARDSDDVNEGK